jgi:glycosyltransferase involved in cell wall biosynthesis
VFGLAAAENMRRGRVAIVPANSAIAEVVGDSGLTFSEGDASGLAAAMRQLIVQPDLRRRLSIAARERSSAVFSEEAMVNSHIALYRSLKS